MHDQVRCGCDYAGDGRYSCGHDEHDPDHEYAARPDLTPAEAVSWARASYAAGSGATAPDWNPLILAECARIEAHA